MIIWGWKQQAAFLPGSIEHSCPICEEEREFVSTLGWTSFHIFWIPLASWGKQHWWTCVHCNNPQSVTPMRSFPYLAGHIPWMHRFGWLALLALAIGGVVIASGAG